MKIQNTSLATRSLFALGLGCTLAVLPFSLASAQDSTEKAPTSATTPIPQTAGQANVGSTAPNQGTTVEPKHTKDTLSLKDKEFMRQAAAGNESEIQLAHLALKNAESAEVKEFAQKMIEDHGMANKHLEQIAQDKGLLNFRPELTAEDKALFARMTSVTGTAFDTDYIKHAVADHETDVKEYKTGENEVEDTDVKQYITKTLVIIEGHLKMAKELSMTKTKAVNS